MYFLHNGQIPFPTSCLKFCSSLKPQVKCCPPLWNVLCLSELKWPAPPAGRGVVYSSAFSVLPVSPLRAGMRWRATRQGRCSPDRHSPSCRPVSDPPSPRCTLEQGRSSRFGWMRMEPRGQNDKPAEAIRNRIKVLWNFCWLVLSGER